MTKHHLLNELTIYGEFMIQRHYTADFIPIQLTCYDFFFPHQVSIVQQVQELMCHRHAGGGRRLCWRATLEEVCGERMVACILVGRTRGKMVGVKGRLQGM